MAQLGYTWYPQDWWTSETFKRLKRFPMVRYALRELFDLMYKEGKPVEMNREYLIDDFNIELTDDQYNKLLEYIEVDADGKWWIKSIKKRISKAEAARENGKKGGRPSKQNKPEKTPINKTQNPAKKTQDENPRNPPLERERETKEKYKGKEKENNARALSILKTKKQSELDVLWMQNKNLIKDKTKLVESFNDKMDLELAQGKIEFDAQQLMPRFRQYVRQWVSNTQDNQSRLNNSPEPNSWESGKLPRRN